MRWLTCRDCGRSWLAELRRGPVPSRCPTCALEHKRAAGREADRRRAGKRGRLLRGDYRFDCRRCGFTFDEPAHGGNRHTVCADCRGPSTLQPPPPPPDPSPPQPRYLRGDYRFDCRRCGFTFDEPAHRGARRVICADCRHGPALRWRARRRPHPRTRTQRRLARAGYRDLAAGIFPTSDQWVARWAERPDLFLRLVGAFERSAARWPDPVARLDELAAKRDEHLRALKADRQRRRSA